MAQTDIVDSIDKYGTARSTALLKCIQDIEQRMSVPVIGAEYVVRAKLSCAETLRRFLFEKPGNRFPAAGDANSQINENCLNCNSNRREGVHSLPRLTFAVCTDVLEYLR